jgi:hypothetical protein
MKRTPFDNVIRGAESALEILALKRHPNDPGLRVARAKIWELGWSLACILSKGQSDDLRKLADALDAYRSPDHVKETVAAMDRLGRSFLTISPDGSLIRHPLKLQTRHIFDNLPKHVQRASKASIQKRIRRAAKILRVKLDRTPGRPKK